ncbi:MAG: ion transporter [Deltaproteobacteria bacterium]|nr:ion transporter [Deltaproteobacteria bacterium]
MRPEQSDRLQPAGRPGSLRDRAYHVIFESEPGWGRRFDVVLIAAILASVGVVLLESVAEIRTRHASRLVVLEWLFTALFSVEYLARVACLRNPRAYTFSFFGLVDLLSVLPAYLSLVLPGGQFLTVVRILRVVRVFRVLKLARYTSEASVLLMALRASRYKIAVFVVSVISIVVVVGSLMYLIEGPENGFTSIPSGIYWAIVTLTTVGFGDITPRTPLGQAVASAVMIMGYGIIAVPTGIITAELASSARGRSGKLLACADCGVVEDDPEARFCRRCGAGLPGDASGR